MADFRLIHDPKNKDPYFLCEVDGKSVDDLTGGVLYRVVTDLEAQEPPRVRLEVYALDKQEIRFTDADVKVVPVELVTRVPDPTDRMLEAGGQLLDQMVDLGGLVPSELANLLWNEMASKWPKGEADVSHRDSV